VAKLSWIPQWTAVIVVARFSFERPRKEQATSIHFRTIEGEGFSRGHSKSGKPSSSWASSDPEAGDKR
jgi:hypothetical protein